MSSCANCGATITCGCQKRTLPNGKSGCTKCAGTTNSNTVQTRQSISITDPSATIPQNKVVWGPDRYRNLNKLQ